jgi:hypothetical protein
LRTFKRFFSRPEEKGDDLPAAHPFDSMSTREGCGDRIVIMGAGDDSLSGFAGDVLGRVAKK